MNGIPYSPFVLFCSRMCRLVSVSSFARGQFSLWDDLKYGGVHFSTVNSRGWNLWLREANGANFIVVRGLRFELLR